MSLIFLCRDSSGTITQILETLDPHHLRKHDAQYSDEFPLSGACTETCIERCASGWVGHKDKCYKLSDTRETWSVGEKSCRCWIVSKFLSCFNFRDQGGHLASVGSSDVDAFLFKWLKEVWFQFANFSSEANFNTH